MDNVRFLPYRYFLPLVQTPEVFRKTPKLKIQFAGPYRTVHRNKKYLHILISNSREHKEPPNHITKSLLIRESENAHSSTFYLSVFICNISIFSASLMQDPRCPSLMQWASAFAQMHNAVFCHSEFPAKQLFMRTECFEQNTEIKQRCCFCFSKAENI